MTEDDLPEIWYSSGPPEKPLQVDGEIYASDSLDTHFLTEKTPRESFLHKVYRFRYIHAAEYEFKKEQKLILKRLPPSQLFLYHSRSAEKTLIRYWRLPEDYYVESRKTTAGNETKGTRYTFIGLYKEFLIIVHVFEYGSMSTSQFKQTIDILDTRMTDFLQR